MDRVLGVVLQLIRQPLNAPSTDWKWLYLSEHIRGYFPVFSKEDFQHACGAGLVKATLASINQKAFKVPLSLNLVLFYQTHLISIADH